MYTLTHGFVLSKIKYRDNDIIVKLYTKELGAVSYIVYGALKRTKKANNGAYFQALSQLQFLSYNKYKTGLYNLKDIRNYNIHKSLQSNIIKSSIALFLAEILAYVLKEEEPNLALYNYLDYAFRWLDSNTDVANFHIVFLLNLTKYLGFYPNTSQIDVEVFDLKEGLFQANIYGIDQLVGKDLINFKSVLGMNFDEMSTLTISGSARKQLLNNVLTYYKYHLEGFFTPKSLQVFNQLFN